MHFKLLELREAHPVATGGHWLLGGGGSLAQIREHANSVPDNYPWHDSLPTLTPLAPQDRNPKLTALGIPSLKRFPSGGKAPDAEGFRQRANEVAQSIQVNT